jgi:hypothetical protein
MLRNSSVLQARGGAAPGTHGPSRTLDTRIAPRLALRPAEAAQSLGCSRDYFDEYIGPELKWIRRGRLKFVPIAELERWLTRTAALTVDERS